MAGLGTGLPRAVPVKSPAWRPAPDVLEAMAQNATRLDDTIEAADAAERGGAAFAAVAFCELAARFAWDNHPGGIGDRRLETLVERAARSWGGAGGPARAPTNGGVRRVLHVLTEAKPVGGHTRLAWNWLREDAGRRHDVALLEQQCAVPRPLVAAAKSTGGRVVDLTRRRRGYTAQIAALTEAVELADVIVLHHHPYDPVPGLVLASAARRPPTILLNHAGRVFATGFGAADVVAWLRPSIADLLGPRRGVPTSRLAHLPIPLRARFDPARAGRLRRRARSRLGIPPEAVCLVTVATSFKYRPVDAVSLPLMLGEYVRGREDVHVVAIGPRERDDWVRASEMTDGRVRALGPQRRTGPFLAAADIAVDSYPISSETAVREAALAGLPVVSFTRLRSLAPATAVDLVGEADSRLVRADDETEFEASLARLVDDPALRSTIGAGFREAVESDSRGPRWRGHVDALYEQAIDSPPMDAGQLGATPRTFDALDAITLLTNPARPWDQDRFRGVEQRLLGGGGDAGSISAPRRLARWARRRAPRLGLGGRS